MVDIRFMAKEGFNMGMENNNFIILNTEITGELLQEGIAREIVSKVQNIRKTLEYNVADRINITFNVSEAIKDAIIRHQDYIQNETLATTISYNNELTKDIDLNGENIGIKIDKE